MTAAPAGSAPLFSMFSDENGKLYCSRPESFLFSLILQALILVLITIVICCFLPPPPSVARRLPRFEDLPLIFSGDSGGGGGNFEVLPASHGNLPRSSLEDQIVPPMVIVPREMRRLPVDETVKVGPDVKLPEGGQIGDPMSRFSSALFNGPGGPSGIGPGCCGGVGPSEGPGFGPGAGGIYPAGKGGVTVPQVIFNPEPGFSDEARKARQQGVVLLLLVVGKDGYPYNIRVGQSLGMGLDEKAIEAVNRWRFRPATLNGQPVATQIAIEVVSTCIEITDIEEYATLAAFAGF